ncbi:hypothetical protein D3C72_1325410 [compost metagenome]
MKSMSVNSRAMVSTAIVAQDTSMKASTEKITRSSMALPPMVTGCTALGCTRRRISRRVCLSSSSMRIILMPPPVEPALVATPDSSSIRTGAKGGHRPKSTVAYPVVVATETVLNTAWRTASAGP